MEYIIAALFILASIFIGSFVSLLLLCHHKKQHLKNKTNYTKKVELQDFREVTEKDSTQEVKLIDRYKHLVKLCQCFDPGAVSPYHLGALHHIIKTAKKLTEESENMMQEGWEEAGLLGNHTTAVLLDASLALASVEKHLSALKEECTDDTAYVI